MLPERQVLKEQPSAGTKAAGKQAEPKAEEAGTWATVIANQRLEEAVQIVDFTVGQNFGEEWRKNHALFDC